ncbi:hypothetical protein AB0G04_18285 [Actinoplanes sp. NPDC023801]|uniref:hypothetical protein n=1 Tax=Actinoplanes sp. NPDC023801 TaxID=3154595 RepID=UPI0033FA9265
MGGGALVAAFSAGAVAFAGSPVSAAAQEDANYWCYGCRVLAAGPLADTGKVFVLLRDPKGEFSDDWFDARKSPDRILTTALAALTSGKTVTVNLADTTQFSAIDRIYLEHEPGIAGS